MNPYRCLRLTPLFACVLFLIGCGSDELSSPTAKKLRALGNLYLEQAVAARGAGPRDEKTFKKHVRATSDQILETMGLQRSDLDSLFASERDQEPFVIVYGVIIGSVSGKEAPLVAYETSGKDGMRLAGFANGKVELVSDPRLEELLKPKQ